MDKLCVGLIFGGRSGEHEVSLQSAQSVIDAMDKEKYEIIPIGITKEGRWIASGDPMRALTAGESAASSPVALWSDPARNDLMQLEEMDQVIRATPLAALDVVFPVLHGPYGEDGTLQGLLELAGLPYVGAQVAASAVAMDKAIFKDVIRAHGLPTVDHVVVRRREWQARPQDFLERVADGFGYPVFVKPANLGSSVGVAKCRDQCELRAGLNDAARYDRKMLVEPAVPAAREIEVSVLGNDVPRASVPGEIIPSREFYSYEAKYIDEGNDASELLIPAPLSAAVTRRVQALAIESYRAIDCAGMARVDFLLSGEECANGAGLLYVNEVNTIPGFTKISMYPKLWEATGLPYSKLIDRLIELALERHRDRMRIVVSYQPGG